MDRSPQAQKRRLQTIMRLWQKDSGADTPERLRVKGFEQGATKKAKGGYKWGVARKGLKKVLQLSKARKQQERKEAEEKQRQQEQEEGAAGTAGEQPPLQ